MRMSVRVDEYTYGRSVVLLQRALLPPICRSVCREVCRQICAGGETALSLGTLRNVDVTVEVHVVDGPDEIQLEDFDHAVEGTFASASGKIAAMGCTDFFPHASRLEVQPGSYLGV